MISISVLPMTTHCKKNQAAVEVMVAKRKFKYTVMNNSIPVIIACVTASIALRLFPPTTKIVKV